MDRPISETDKSRINFQACPFWPICIESTDLPIVTKVNRWKFQDIVEEAVQVVWSRFAFRPFWFCLPVTKEVIEPVGVNLSRLAGASTGGGIRRTFLRAQGEL